MAGRLGEIVVAAVGVARPERGIRLGVMTTEGILGGGEPRTLAIGEAFHLGRASRGISPIVPVPCAVDGRCAMGDFARGLKKGANSREDREDEDVVVETDRLRGVGVAMRLSLRWGGREVTLLPDLTDEVREAVGEMGA